MTNTRKILERVPDDKLDYKPHEKSMPLGRLAGHVAEMPGWAKTTIATELLEMEPGQQPYSAKSRQELLDSFDKSVAEAREMLAGVSDEQLGRDLDVAVRRQGRVRHASPGRAAWDGDESHDSSSRSTGSLPEIE
jgi:hypothetical protein